MEVIMEEWTGYGLILIIEATKEYLYFDSQEELDEYVKEHNLLKGEYTEKFYIRELPPLPVNDEH